MMSEQQISTVLAELATNTPGYIGAAVVEQISGIIVAQ